MNRYIWIVAIVFAAGMSVHASADESVLVSNVEELYAAVNDPANAGGAIVLAPGTYTLSAVDPAGSARPHGGRLELQTDMSLSGVEGDRSAVVIDGSALPLSSFTVPFGRTGVIRIGRGTNALEWITVQGNVRSAGGIETDLTETSATYLRIAHVVSAGSLRGVDVRNIGALMAGRRIDVEVSDGDFSADPAGPGVTEGIRIANTNDASGGEIHAVTSGNRFHDAKTGCLAANDFSSYGVIDVRSNGDTFEDNGAGCILFGGSAISGTVGAGNSNSVTFEAYGSAFRNNTAPSFKDAGGIIAVAGESPVAANAASGNTLIVRLWGCEISGNPEPQFQAFGARSTSGGIAGTFNHTIVELHGVTKFVDVVAVDSSPADPGATNTVTVVR
jgi:hypothetical protein